MTAHTPTPEEAESAIFLIRWWQEILGGAILSLMTLLLKSKGRKRETAIVPMSEEEINHRMTICKQGVFLDMHKILDERDRRLETKLDHRDEMFLEKIEVLHIRLNKEAAGQ